MNQKAESSRDIDGGGVQPIDAAREKNAPLPPLRQNRQVLGCKRLRPTRRITLMGVFPAEINRKITKHHRNHLLNCVTSGWDGDEAFLK